MMLVPWASCEAPTSDDVGFKVRKFIYSFIKDFVE